MRVVGILCFILGAVLLVPTVCSIIGILCKLFWAWVRSRYGLGRLVIRGLSISVKEYTGDKDSYKKYFHRRLPVLKNLVLCAIPFSLMFGLGVFLLS